MHEKVKLHFSPSNYKKNVLFHLRVALFGAETCSKLMLVIIYTHNK